MAECEITCSICHGARRGSQIGLLVLYAVLFIAGNSLISNAITLGGSLGFASLPRPELFGQQRAWGTVGFGIAAFLASRAYGQFKTEFVYLIIFAVLCLLCVAVTSFIRIQPKKQEPVDELKGSPATSKTSALLQLLKKPDVLIFLSLSLIWGTSYAILDPVSMTGVPVLCVTLALSLLVLVFVRGRNRAV